MKTINHSQLLLRFLIVSGCLSVAGVAVASGNPAKFTQASDETAPQVADVKEEAQKEVDVKAEAEAKTETKTKTEAVAKTKTITPAAVASQPAPAASPDKLKSALEYVYTNNPQIKAQREALKVADEGVAQAVSGFRPSAGVELSKGRERTGTTSETWNYDSTKSRGLSVTQPLFSGGGTIASFMSAKESVKAARANLSAVEQQVIYNAVVAYTDVVEKESVLELNQKNVDVLQKQMDVTEARFKVGELTITDVSQAKARLAQAQADEQQALGDLAGSRATFRRVIGYDPEGGVAMPAVPSGIPQSLAEAKEWANDNNPVLIAARHSEQAADNNIYVQGATLLPSVNLQGTMSRATGGSTVLHDIDNDSIKVNVSIPLYQSGAEWSRVREARNLAQQAKFNSLDTNQSVVESVTQAWEALSTSKAVITSSEAAVKAAEVALDGVRKENEFGVRTILDVLNAEQETFSVRVNLVKAVRTEKLQAYRLLASVGKLTAKDLDLKTDVEDPKEHYDSVKYQLLGL